MLLPGLEAGLKPGLRQKAATGVSAHFGAADGLGRLDQHGLKRRPCIAAVPLLPGLRQRCCNPSPLYQTCMTGYVPGQIPLSSE